MRHGKALFWAILIVGSSSSLAAAQITIPEVFVHVWTESSGPVAVTVVPDGSGDTFDQAQEFGGAVVDATIRLRLTDVNDVPIAHFPAEDIWLGSILGGLVVCTGGSVADDDTDANGETYWRASLLAGGCVDPGVGDQLIVYFVGDPCDDSPALRFHTVRSPDLNGDLIVNLQDLALFAHDYLYGYSSCSDFHWDGALNIADIGEFAVAYGRSCP